MSLVSLNTLSVGEQAYVNKLGFGANDRRRMQDIGLIDGTRVECLGKAISGDPAAYLIRGAVIALRSEDAAKIASALDAGDRELAHRLAHTLKGVGASLGLLLLQEKSTEMDAAFKAGQPPDAIRALLPGLADTLRASVEAARGQQI